MNFLVSVVNMSAKRNSNACAALILVGHLMEEEDATKSKRQCWSRIWLLKREKKGSYGCLFSDLMNEDESIQNYFFKFG